MPSRRELLRTLKTGLNCDCPKNCKYCGARRKLDSVGHYCPTKNCQWEHGYAKCSLFRGRYKGG